MILGIKKQTLIILFLILSLASFLRFYDLSNNPVSLFGDEVDLGYQAYSILKTGRDYSGNPWPINFQSLGDWRTPLYLYSAVPTIAILGLNALGVRAPAAIFGVLGILLTFLLVRKLFKNDTWALLASLFLTISPWHLQYSRAGFEATLLSLALLSGVYFFLKGLEDGKFLTISAIFFGATPFIYSTAKLFTPLMAIVLLVLYFKQFRKISSKYIVIAGLVVVLFAGLMGKDIIFGHAKDRAMGLIAINDPQIITQINLRRGIDSNQQQGQIGVQTPLSAKFFHNKAWSWGINFVGNYLSTFSPEFLFLKGDPNFRQSVFEMGELYLAELFFLFFGFYQFLRKEKGRERNFLLLWFFLSPLPASLTSDGAKHATRLFVMLPVFQIFIAYGFYKAIILSKKINIVKVLWILLTGLLLANFIFYLHRYYVDYPHESSRWWNYGYKEAFDYLKRNDQKYEAIIISNNDSSPIIYFLFYYGFDPATFQKTKIERVSFRRIDSFKLGKYYFGGFDGNIINQRTQGKFLTDKMIYMASAANFKDRIDQPDVSYENLRVMKTMFYPDTGVSNYMVVGASDMTSVLRNEGELHD